MRDVNVTLTRMQPPPPGLPLDALPFLGVLLSLALLPSQAPHFWHRWRFGVMGGWVLLVLLLEAETEGVAPLGPLLLHGLIGETLPVLAPLVALYLAASGVMIEAPGGTAWRNALWLLAGMALASLIGTLGASVVLLNPFLRANRHRAAHNRHLPLFFVLLVANAGGALSPLGDPPLLLAYVNGLPFSWPLAHLGPLLLRFALPLFALFFLFERRFLLTRKAEAAPARLRLTGCGPLALLLAIDAVVFAESRLAGPPLFGIPGLEPGKITGSLIALALGGLALYAAPRRALAANRFSLDPVSELACVLPALFLTLEPVYRLLPALSGALPRTPPALFLLTGLASAVLDNAPTFLLFFRELGGVEGPQKALEAIAAGAVFGGGLTYVGNAPNLLVRLVASRLGIPMPGFFAFAGLALLLAAPSLLWVTMALR